MMNQLTFPPDAPKVIECNASDAFQAWLSQVNGSLAITTYQAGKLALVGWNGQQVTVLLRQFPKPMGLAVQEQRLALATNHEVWLFANAPLLADEYLENQPGRYDTLYLPRATYFTGDLNIHDLAFGSDNLWLVNTRFSCLAALSKDYNFVPRWQPRFISQLAPEDRCHLNGLAMVDGRPKFVTALGESNEVGGWRNNKATGGILIDVESGEIVIRGLSMPHSPCWHERYLWLLNSGEGELWRINPHSGQHDVVCALPGFLRGLCCVGNYALVGLSQIREQHIFGGLPVQQRFKRLLCGVAVVDLRSGQLVGMLEFTAGCQELYDVEFLPSVLRPTILNNERPEMRQAFTAPEFSYWLRPSSQMTG
ncbi:TIGR03032 family protein [Microcoleus sp. FACHB-SPT15]|uniref:TIGR03032 family protein n=1 Tax=Microcoleus sp. FACHB-SPT15 TaxID=2692830 RepID=UPI0018EF7935|nr:TIGR03032 family protein [Microcoleus sp. FACHB-SPT15]